MIGVIVNGKSPTWLEDKDEDELYSLLCIWDDYIRVVNTILNVSINGLFSELHAAL